MGDRTSVTLRILHSQSEEAESLFDEEPGHLDESDDQYVEYYFDEVNYGNLDFLKELRDAGIAFDSEWDSGGDYTAGTHSCRFTESGELIEKHIYDENLCPPLYELLRLIDDYPALKKFIEDFNDSVSTLDWDNQEEYGKKYLVMKLLDPNQASPTPL